MSYEITLEDPESGPVTEWNITYNVAPLFNDHFPGDGVNRGLRTLDGLTPEQVVERIGVFLVRFEQTRNSLWVEGAVGEPQLTARYDASNGWGSVIGALSLLARIAVECASAPSHYVLRVC